VDSLTTLVTNFEVLQLLLIQKKEQKDLRERIQNSKASVDENNDVGNDEDTISRDFHDKRNKRLKMIKPFEEKLFQYLATSPASKQTSASILATESIWNKYQLTKVEQLQMLNLCPISDVEAHGIIEECDERISSLLELVEEFNTAVFEKNARPKISSTPSQEQIELARLQASTSNSNAAPSTQTMTMVEDEMQIDSEGGESSSSAVSKHVEQEAEEEQPLNPSARKRSPKQPSTAASSKRSPDILPIASASTTITTNNNNNTSPTSEAPSKKSLSSQFKDIALLTDRRRSRK